MSKKQIILGVAAAFVLIGVASSCGSTSQPLAQAPAATSVAAPAAPAEAPAAPVATEQPVAEVPAATTCDIAREALLTGTASDITAAMQGLKADKAADATAREYADYYMNRDKDSKDMREADKGLIQMSCS